MPALSCIFNVVRVVCRCSAGVPTGGAAEHQQNIIPSHIFLVIFTFKGGIGYDKTTKR